MKTKTFITALLLCATIGVLADEPKALLDSIIIDQCTSMSKYEYTYNQSNLVSSEVYFTQKSGKWKPSQKKEYTYNIMGKVETCIQYEPNVDTNGWQNNTKSEYVYNSHGDQIERTDSMWNMDSEMWLTRYQQLKTSYTYDADDRITSSIDSFLYLNIYTQVHKYTYKYDASGKLIARETFFWNEDLEVFGEAGKRIYTYDSDGNLIEILTYDWDNKAESFKKSGRYEMIYDENGYLISEVVSMWKDDGEWLLINKNTYYYHGYNTAIDYIETSGNALSTKFFRNGQLFILRDGKTYTVQGQEVK